MRKILSTLCWVAVCAFMLWFHDSNREILVYTVNAANTYDTIRQSGTADYTNLKTALLAMGTTTPGDTAFFVADSNWTIIDGLGGHTDFDQGDLSGVALVQAIGPARHSGSWCDTCHVWGLPGGTFYDFEQGPYIFDGIQINDGGNNATYLTFSLHADIDSIIYHKVIWKYHGRLISPGGVSLLNSVKFGFDNCVIIDTTGFSSGDAAIQLSSSDDGGRINFYNTVVHGGNDFFQRISGAQMSLRVKNCIFTDFVTWGGNTAGLTSANTLEYTLVDTAETGPMPSDTENVYWSTTATFVDETSPAYDLHLDPSDTDAKDKGEDLSGDTQHAFDDDIDYETRSGTWDIGPDELPVTGIGMMIIIGGDH